MGAKIAAVNAIEILDSRGNPTLRTSIALDDGRRAFASVPSGASTGEHEAHELRDGDPARFKGKGVLRAVDNVARVIAPKIVGLDPSRQRDIDQIMIELDGTENKSRLGANAILGVSMAVARAAADAAGLPLYRQLGGQDSCRMPVPMMNVINGGTHADNSLDFQEFMLVPHGAPTFAEALRYGAETFSALKALLAKLGHTVSVGDEGGFAPQLPDNKEACNLILEAIHSAGFGRGKQIAIALDPAASAFCVDGGYALIKSGEGVKTSRQMIDLYCAWVEYYTFRGFEEGRMKWRKSPMVPK